MAPKLLKQLMSRLQRPEDDGSDLGGGDVARGDNGDVVGTGNDARVAMLERINDSNDQFRADELANVNDDGSTEAFTALLPGDDNGVTERELQRAADETADGAPDPVDPAPVPQLITRKINGRDVTLPLDDWLTRASKVEAADQYLNEAARIHRNANQQNLPVPSPTDVPAPPAVDRRALVRAIQMGTEEEAAAALDQLLSAVPKPEMSPDILARTVDERLTFKSAISKFEEEYSDILSDPLLRQLALQRDAELVAQGDTRNYFDRYSAIGNDLRTWRDNLAKTNAPQNVSVDSLAGKAIAKANAASRTPPKGTGVKAPVTTVSEEPEEDVRGTIAAMAKSRGGPQWSRA